MTSKSALGPLYIATERFGPQDAAWENYIRFSGLSQLSEVVSLDGLLCPTVLKEILEDDWPHIVNENFILHYFTDLIYLMKRVESIKEKNLLCVYCSPLFPPTLPITPIEFEFKGYDLIEADGSISALVNCGGFPDLFQNEELSTCGLFLSFERAWEIKYALQTKYSSEIHAHCDVWAIFKAKSY